MGLSPISRLATVGEISYQVPPRVARRKEGQGKDPRSFMQTGRFTAETRRRRDFIKESRGKHSSQACHRTGSPQPAHKSTAGRDAGFHEKALSRPTCWSTFFYPPPPPSPFPSGFHTHFVWAANEPCAGEGPRWGAAISPTHLALRPIASGVSQSPGRDGLESGAGTENTASGGPSTIDPDLSFNSLLI